jgi:hypothetical protein
MKQEPTGQYTICHLPEHWAGRSFRRKKYWKKRKKPFFTILNAEIIIIINHMQMFLVTAKVKIKVTFVQALRLCTGRTVHRGSRGIALLFHDHDTRRR